MNESSKSAHRLHSPTVDIPSTDSVTSSLRSTQESSNHPCTKKAKLQSIEKKSMLEVNPEELSQLNDEIGRGSFGIVYKFTFKGTQTAVKVLSLVG